MPYTVPPRSHTTPAMQHRISTGQHQRHFFGTQIKSIRRAGFRTKRPPISSHNYKNLAAHKPVEGCFKPGLTMTVLTLLQLAALSQHNSLLPSAQKRSESSALCIPPVKPNRDILPYRTPSTVPSLPLIQTHQSPPAESKTGRKPWSLLPVAEASPLPANSNKGLPSTNDQRDFEMGEVLAELSHLISINDSTNLLHIFDLLDKISALLELYPDHQTQSYFPAGVESADLRGETPLQMGARTWAAKRGCAPLNIFPSDGTTKQQVGFVLEEIGHSLKDPVKAILNHMTRLVAIFSGNPCLAQASATTLSRTSIAASAFLDLPIGLTSYAASTVVGSAFEEAGHSLAVGKIDQNHLIKESKETLVSLATLAAFHAAGTGVSEATNKLINSSIYKSAQKTLADNTARLLGMLGDEAERIFSAQTVNKLVDIMNIVGMSAEHLTGQKVFVRKYNSNFEGMARTEYERAQDVSILKTMVQHGEIPHALVKEDGKAIVVELDTSGLGNLSAKPASPKITAYGESIQLDSIQYINEDKGFVGVNSVGNQYPVFFDHITGKWEHAEFSQQEINEAAMLSPRGNPDFIPLKILATDKQSFTDFLNKNHYLRGQKNKLTRLNGVPSDIPLFLGTYKRNIIQYISYRGFEVPITRVITNDGIEKIMVLDPEKQEPTEYIVRFKNSGIEIEIDDTEISILGCNRIKRSIDAQSDCEFPLFIGTDGLTKTGVLKNIFYMRMFMDDSNPVTLYELRSKRRVYIDINTGLIHIGPKSTDFNFIKSSSMQTYKIIPIDNDKIRLERVLFPDHSTTFTPVQAAEFKKNLGLEPSDLYKINPTDYTVEIPNRVNMCWVGPKEFPHISELEESLRNTEDGKTQFHIFLDSDDPYYTQTRDKIMKLKNADRVTIHDVKEFPLLKDLVGNPAYSSAKQNGYSAFLSDIARYIIQGTEGIGGVYIDTKHTIQQMPNEKVYIEDNGLLISRDNIVNPTTYNNDIIVTSARGSSFLLDLAKVGLKTLSNNAQEIANHVPSSPPSQSSLTHQLLHKFGVKAFSKEIINKSSLARYSFIAYQHHNDFVDLEWHRATSQFTSFNYGKKAIPSAHVKKGKYQKSWDHE